jgi:Transglutaminase-like superfamily
MMNLETRAPMAAMSMAIPEGDAGTIATIDEMRRLIDHGMKDPVVHELAAEIIKAAGVRAFDWMGEARAVYNWVRANIRFTRDVRGKETLHAAREIIRLGIGDCDDFTILICALMGTLGANCHIITVSSDPRAPEIFSHVYPIAKVGGRWIAMDAARRDPAFGREPARYFRKREWDATSPDWQDIAGLGAAHGHAAFAAPLFRRVNPMQGMGAHAPLRFRRRNPMQGLGRARGFRGLGQSSDEFNYSQLPTDITATTVGISDIIAASRANPANLTATTSLTPQSLMTSLSTQGFMGLSLGTWLIMLVGGGIALYMAENR